MDMVLEPRGDKDICRAFGDRHTPHRSKASVYNRMENELIRITNRIHDTHNTHNTTHKHNNAHKPQLTRQQSLLEPTSLKRETRNKQNTVSKHRDSRRDSLSKKEHNTPPHFTSLNDKYSECPTKKDPLFPLKSHDVSQQPNSFGVLLKQNQKLAIRVGELESACEAMSQKSMFLKGRLQEQTKRWESKCYQELKEKVYFEKLSDFYKEKALAYMRLLKENGIRVPNQLSQGSLTEESEEYPH